MVFVTIWITAIEPATLKLPDIKKAIIKVLALPVILQLIVFIKLRVKFSVIMKKLLLCIGVQSDPRLLDR